ncbi:uncharacterized protein LOC122546502, partial [Chiloscyllium plagiosum]|uniref:uncharacterized protein LOC122546502 n=1 Tax=Chiloscyllium plagiosum TaxID=36176 RepID=UPI001CB7F22C
MARNRSMVKVTINHAEQSVAVQRIASWTLHTGVMNEKVSEKLIPATLFNITAVTTTRRSAIAMNISPARSFRLPEKPSPSRLCKSSAARGSSTMGLLLVLTLCVYLPRSFCQSVVQTPRADTKEECQSLNINCVFYGGFFASPLKRGEFFRQTQTGTKRERILSGGRFVVRTNTAEKTFSLEVQNLNVKDTATYYCKAWYHTTHSDLTQPPAIPKRSLQIITELNQIPKPIRPEHPIFT